MKTTEIITKAIKEMENLTNYWEIEAFYEKVDKAIINNYYFKEKFHTPEEWKEYETEIAKLKKAHEIKITNIDSALDAELMFQ